MEDKVLYYDRFQECYVKEKDLFAPPERYIKYIFSGIKKDMVMECWAGSNGTRLSFSYVPTDADASMCTLSQLRRKHFEQHNFSPRLLLRMVVPMSMYPAEFENDDGWREEDHGHNN